MNAIALTGALLLANVAASTRAQAQDFVARNAALWDTFADTWIATDALGRTTPTRAQVGAPRKNKTVGIFYFLWLGQHGNAGPFDVTAILKRDPKAMQKPNSPLWGPVFAPHHWGKPVFDYYVSTDEWVLRKHAQMLSDAGVNLVFFDNTNQLTYRRAYMALCRVWSQIRKEGGKTPQIVFLTPFGDPTRVVRTLYRNFYKPRQFSDLWFRWQGKPLILANPNLLSTDELSVSQVGAISLNDGEPLGQTFRAPRPFTAIGGSFPTYTSKDSAMTLSLYKLAPNGKLPGRLVTKRRFEKVRDNSQVLLEAGRALPAGDYYLEMSQPKNAIGWWSQSDDVYSNGRAFSSREAAEEGDRTLFVRYPGSRNATELVPQQIKSAAIPAAPPRPPSERVPARVEIGGTLGQSFKTTRPLVSVSVGAPTWYSKTSSVTLSLRQGGANGRVLASRRFENIADGAQLSLQFSKSLPAGTYYLEMSQPRGTVGWWSQTGNVEPFGQAYANGVAASGDRDFSMVSDSALHREIANFFTFRAPRADIFGGPKAGNRGEWGWLDVYPQKVFPGVNGKPEQMSVGIAQNAVDGKLSVLSNPNSRGRSFHNGKQPPASQQDFFGRNFNEQAAFALKTDPSVVLVTGWNEWIAGRFPQNNDFYGMNTPVNFVDQFNREYSRDIEPVVGGHTDSFYYQFADFVRRYKGVRPLPKASAPRRIALDGRFSEWQNVAPEYRDDRFDTRHRDTMGWGRAGRLVNKTGRNDFVRSKVARDANNIYFYTETRLPIIGASTRTSEWMQLLVDERRSGRGALLGFDTIISSQRDGKTALVEKVARGTNGRITRRGVGRASLRIRGNEIEIAVPRRLLNSNGANTNFDFKWLDNTSANRDALNLYRNGDTAPNGRFRYRYAS